MPQPKVITIQPEPLPFVFGSTTFATTPLPSSTNRVVPINSAKYCFMTTYKSLIFGPTSRAANGVAPSRANCGCLIGRHLWFETTIDFPMPSDGISTLPNTSGHPSQVRGAKRRRLRYLRPNNRELHDIGLILQQRVVNRRAAVDAKLRHRIAGITSHRIGEVGNLQRNTFDRRPGNMPGRRPAGNSQNRPASVRIPMRRTEADKRRH